MANKDKQRSKKWAAFWIGLTAFVVVAAVLVGLMGWRTSGFKDWTFGFGKPSVSTPDNTDKPNNPDKPNDVSGEGSFLVSPDEGGIMTLSVANDVAAQSADSYTITATISPDNATIKDITWSIGFKNASSSWASGKNVTDYVTLVGSGSSATVTCLNPFGEQIIVTATSVSNSSIKATCTLDYVKRVESVSLDYKHYYEGYKPNFGGEDVDMIRSYTLGVGTIEGTFTWSNEAKVGINPALNINFEGHRLYPAFEDAQSGYDTSIDDFYFVDYTEEDTVNFAALSFLELTSGSGYIKAEARPYFNAIIYDNLNGVQNAGYVSLTYTYTYGTHNEQGTATTPYFEFDVSEFYTDVSNMNLNIYSWYF